MTVRDNLLGYIRKRLVGPFGDDEVLTDVPTNHYTAGILHPQPDDGEQGGDISDRMPQHVDEGLSVAVGNPGTDDADDYDEPVVLASQHRPSVIGVSFLLSGSVPEVNVGAKFAVYTRQGNSTRYKRTPFSTGGASGPTVRLAHGAGDSRDLMDGRARLRGIFRPHGQGWLVTIVLMNLRRGSSNVSSCLFQTSISCTPAPDSTILPWPVQRAVSGGPEVAQLEMLYRRRKVYAVGHGCAAQWDPGEDPPTAVRSEAVPSLEVPATEYLHPSQTGSRALSIAWIASNPPGLLDELARFVEAYETWIDDLRAGPDAREAEFEAPRASTLEKLRTASERMRNGIDVLRTDHAALKAFCFASRAMLAQMHRTAEYRDRPRGQLVPRPPKAIDQQVRGDTRSWRPFQLAYQLQVLPSLVTTDPDLEPNRTVVDLLWFPTGGGKTEAYLALVAFELFYRRLRYPSQSGGTAVIMRYTLRLLTTQQFQRATALICAAELLRREFLSDTPPITIGLWVGGQTPNTIRDAEERLHVDMYQGSPPRNPFVTDRCGWCGTYLVPETATNDHDAYGFRIKAEGGGRRLEARCLHPDCPFHDGLPILHIDSDIYREPPSFLLGTVDKFARLAWVSEAGAIFGNRDVRPPGLIIQDELHLVSGPLGTIVGLYEMAIEALATRDGNRPKIIAATATIRSAAEQVRALYDREVAIFPPPGLDASDSYFARENPSRPGRLYVGVYSDSHSGQMIVIRVLATLLNAPDALGLVGSDRDAYWTLVGYHNSLRELGRVLTLAADDVPIWMRTFAVNQAPGRTIGGTDVEELTSNRSSGDLVELLGRLRRRFDQRGQISLLLATNMLSVGVDVDRLGLMFVNGQPKSTSEYIQATSRVGRASVDGLVVTYYAAAKPRDRSHFERFQSYHQALYRAVEPMSVTPFAEPARRRALHAALVIIVRHRLGLARDDQAPDFKESIYATGLYAEVRDEILERIRRIDPEEVDQSKMMLDSFAQYWADHLSASDLSLRYSKASKGHEHNLLRQFESKTVFGTPTLNSMRNVDQSVLIQNRDRRPRSN